MAEPSKDTPASSSSSSSEDEAHPAAPPVQPVEKKKRHRVSENSLKALAAAREKALEMRKAKGILSGAEKAQAKLQRALDMENRVKQLREQAESIVVKASTKLPPGKPAAKHDESSASSENEATPPPSPRKLKEDGGKAALGRADKKAKKHRRAKPTTPSESETESDSDTEPVRPPPRHRTVANHHLAAAVARQELARRIHDENLRLAWDSLFGANR